MTDEGKALAGELYDIVEKMLYIASRQLESSPVRDKNRQHFIDFCAKSEEAE